MAVANELGLPATHGVLSGSWQGAEAFAKLLTCACACVRPLGWLAVRATRGGRYESVLPNTGGAVASYIPSLAKVKPDQLAISITTVDGQHFSIGDTEAQVTSARLRVHLTTGGGGGEWRVARGGGRGQMS